MSARAAAAHAAAIKLQKYAALQATHVVVPVAVEMMGSWCKEGLDFVRELGRRMSMITNDPRETIFLLQRIAVAVQRGNAASCAGTLPSVEGASDD